MLTYTLDGIILVPEWVSNHKSNLNASNNFMWIQTTNTLNNNILQIDKDLVNMDDSDPN